MRKRLPFVLLAALAAARGVSAQPAEGPLHVVHEEHVKPSRIAEYEAANRDFQAMVKKNLAAMPNFRYTALQGEDFTWYFVAPIKGFAGMDAISKDFAALAQAEGARFADLMKRSGTAMEYWKDWVVMELPTLSYQPATPRLKTEELQFFRYDYYYVMGDKEMEAEAVAAEFAALYKSKNVPNGYRVFKGVAGIETPVIIVESGGKDAADLHAADAKDRAALGEAFEKLIGRAFAITRRFETRNGMLRNDVAVPPAPAGK
jgi:hypothetical protein